MFNLYYLFFCRIQLNNLIKIQNQLIPTKNPFQQIINKYLGGMQFGDNDSIQQQGGDIQQILGDLILNDENTNQFTKKDTTIFIIDCCQSIMKPFEDQTKSQFDKIIQCYSNFMMSKIIANTKDQVGLILYNINNKNNSLNFDHIQTVHQLSPPSAQIIRAASSIIKDYIQKYGISNQQVPLHQILWLYGNQVKQLDNSKHHLRLFLFTAEDCPHPIGDQRREQAINHARQLVSKNVQIELFPIRKSKKCQFDIRKFYQEIITVNPEQLNDNALDNSNKILDLQSRLRQKQFKKRTLNRLLMKVGTDTDIGIKIFSLYNKAKKPLGKKIQATSNKPLKKVVKKMNRQGEIMYDEQIGTYYPLGGQKVKITKNDMQKIKSVQQPGITLIGFKPKKLIKPYHNIKTSYFLYPDEEHVSGSSQFFDALIDELTDTDMVAIVKIVAKQHQQLRFAALFPQKQHYDSQNHEQTAPGFNMILLPYADDIVNFSGTKTNISPTPISSQLIQVTKLLINNLTVNNFDFRDFQNPSLQKFYSHLQAHALNQQTVQQRNDLLLPDYEGLLKFKDVLDLVKQVTIDQIQQIKKQNNDNKVNSDNDDDIEYKKIKKCKKSNNKEIKKQQQQPQKKSKIQTQKTNSKSSKNNNLTQIKYQINDKQNTLREVQAAIILGQGHKLKIGQLRQYLQSKQLSTKGQKQHLIDRIMVYLSHLNSI